jgi:hypothetical protein
MEFLETFGNINIYEYYDLIVKTQPIRGIALSISGLWSNVPKNSVSLLS